jgi:flagellar basal body P-ring protein FlgI
MKYKVCMREDGTYSINNQDNGVTLKLATPNLKLVNRIVHELNEAYNEGYQLGYKEANEER